MPDFAFLPCWKQRTGKWWLCQKWVVTQTPCSFAFLVFIREGRMCNCTHSKVKAVLPGIIKSSHYVIWLPCVEKSAVTYDVLCTFTVIEKSCLVNSTFLTTHTQTDTHSQTQRHAQSLRNSAVRCWLCFLHYQLSIGTHLVRSVSLERQVKCKQESVSEVRYNCVTQWLCLRIFSAAFLNSHMSIISPGTTSCISFHRITES